MEVDWKKPENIKRLLTISKRRNREAEIKKSDIVFLDMFLDHAHKNIELSVDDFFGPLLITFLDRASLYSQLLNRAIFFRKRKDKEGISLIKEAMKIDRICSEDNVKTFSEQVQHTEENEVSTETSNFKKLWKICDRMIDRAEFLEKLDILRN